MEDPVTADTVAADLAQAVPVGAAEQFLRLMDSGGPVLSLLLVISILALTLIIAKLFQFWILRVYARGFVEPVLQAWHQGRNSEALGILHARRSPLARVLEVALQGLASGAPSEDLIKEEVTRVYQDR